MVLLHSYRQMTKTGVTDTYLSLCQSAIIFTKVLSALVDFHMLHNTQNNCSVQHFCLIIVFCKLFANINKSKDKASALIYSKHTLHFLITYMS